MRKPRSTAQTCDLFNIRLSKCGGFLNSLRLAAIAHAAGLGFQLGCHPGESGILSAAGRHWACSVKGIRYLEGSYDRHLFRTTADERGHHVRLRRPGAGTQLAGAGRDGERVRFLKKMTLTCSDEFVDSA